MTKFLAGPAGILYVDDGGEGGLPVFFLHSFAGSSADWSGQLPLLRQERRALAMDFRGHGLSAAPASGAYSVSALTGDLAAAVEALGLRRFHLVGHSLGGSVAAAYAAVQPERVASLMLVSTPGKPDPAESNRVVAALHSDFGGFMDQIWSRLLDGARPELQARVRSQALVMPAPRAMAVIEAVIAYDPLPALRAYPGPKMLVDSSQAQAPSALHEQLPELPRQVIPGTSHWPHMDKPDDFNALLQQFLRQKEGARV